MIEIFNLTNHKKSTFNLTKNRMKKLLQSLFILLFIAVTAMAQDRTITGTVTAKEDGLPLPGVSVLIKGTKTGTQTGTDGKFTIKVPQGQNALTFSFIGYMSKSITLGTSSNLAVTLESDSRLLSEVVVTGYGVQAKRDVAGAISSVKAKDIENLPLQSFDKALQGRAAGVLVQANNGIPGGGVNVRIRGTGSVNAGNQPLYVVDGVQLNARNDASFTQANPLAFLNSNDIESIDVLKDAASAAIYGAQAANGVVIITTKKGKAGKTKFNFNYYTGRVQELKQLDVLNSQEYFDLRSEAFANRNNVAKNSIGGSGAATNIAFEMGLPYTNAAGTAFLSYADQMGVINTTPTYDWQKAVFNDGTLRNYEITSSGGNDKTTFYTSASYNQQEAIIKKVDFRRATFKADLSHKATDKLTFATSLNLSSFTQKIPFSTGGSFLGEPAFSGSLMIPSNPIYNANGTYAGLSPSSLPGILNQNIVAVNEFNQGFQRTNQAIGNFTGTYKINNDLTFKSFFGLDYRLVQGKRYRDPRTPDGFARRGLGEVQSDWNTNFITTQTINYIKQFGTDHSLNALAGVEYKSEVNEGISGAADGFPSFQFQYLNSAANPLSVGEFFTTFRRMGAFSRLNYTYKGRYIFAFTGRYDGSSRFGQENRFGFFPSVQAAWNMKEENFMKNSEVISNFKLRASYGQTGNDQIGNFDALGLYGSGGIYIGAPGIAPSSLANASLKWERNETKNIGLDLGFFNDRLNANIDLYERTSNDLLLAQPVQWTTGFSSYSDNVGQMKNSGVELELNTVNIAADNFGDFEWTTRFNFAYNKNEVTRLYGGFQQLPSNTGIQVGRSLNTVFTNRYAGVNPATGRPMWYDINGNIIYALLAADRVNIGDQEPDFYGGFTNNFRYKGFELDLFFQYEYGRLATDGQVNFLLENGNRSFNTLQVAYDNRWKKPGDITSYPRPFDTGAEAQGNNHMAGSSRIWRKADYIRLKNVTFSYTLNQKQLNKTGLNSARLYFQGTNLFTYDDWMGYDPEFFGGATGIIPQSKNFTLGIQIGL